MFGDTFNLIRYGEAFVMDELVRRAIESEEGYSETYIGPWFWPFKQIYVFTGKQYIADVSVYGQDPVARRPFDDLVDFLGSPFVISQTDPEMVKEERTALMRNLKAKPAMRFGYYYFQNLFNNWDPNSSINREIDFVCAQIISKSLYNASELPKDEMINLIHQGEHAVFNRAQIGEAEFQEIRNAFKSVSDIATARNRESILDKSHPNYLQNIANRNPDKKLEDHNAFSALIVAGNLSALLTGLMIQLGSRPDLMRRLKAELQDFDFQLHDLKEKPFLHSLYLEGLRFFAPAGPMPRETSVDTQIGDKLVPAGSILLVPTRAILHDPKHWKDPHVFNPDRQELKKFTLGEYPFIPFSEKRRGCPAGHEFVEAVVMSAFIALKDYDLHLHPNQTIEVIPPRVKEARFATHYFATLQKSANESRRNLAKSDGGAVLRRSRRLTPSDEVYS